MAVFNRTVSKAEDLANQFDCDFAPLSKESNDILEKYNDIIIQTTNVGMHPIEHINPLDFYSFSGKEFLYDIIYSPEETLFLKSGKNKGCKILNGWSMLLEQGYRQFKLFTGEEYPA